MKNDRGECARENKSRIPEQVNKVWGKNKVVIWKAGFKSDFKTLSQMLP